MISRSAPSASHPSCPRHLSGSKITNLLMPFDFVRVAKTPKEPKMSKDDKATLYVRITPEVHRRARVRALSEGVNLGEIVEVALVRYLAAETNSDVVTGQVTP